MKTISVYSFEELSDTAKNNALHNVKNEWVEQDRGYDFGRWSVDDCSLFEPKHSEMAALLGEDYTERNHGRFIFKNNRREITFDINSRENDFSKAIEITNIPSFMLWLGISEEIYKHNKFSWEIYYTGIKTEISLKLDIDLEDPIGLTGSTGFMLLTAEEFPKAILKFRNHIRNVMERIKVDVSYRWSNEGILEEITNGSHEYTFTSSGKLIDINIFE